MKRAWVVWWRRHWPEWWHEFECLLTQVNRTDCAAELEEAMMKEAIYP